MLERQRHRFTVARVTRVAILRVGPHTLRVATAWFDVASWRSNSLKGEPPPSRRCGEFWDLFSLPTIVQGLWDAQASASTTLRCSRGTQQQQEANRASLWCWTAIWRLQVSLKSNLTRQQTSGVVAFLVSSSDQAALELCGDLARPVCCSGPANFWPSAAGLTAGPARAERIGLHAFPPIDHPRVNNQLWQTWMYIGMGAAGHHF